METIAHPSLVKLGNRIANRVMHVWLRSHGADISHLRRELAEEAIGGLSLALAEAEIPLATLEAEGATLPREILRAGFRAAQSTLRKFARHDSYETAWHPDMELQDNPAKDAIDAARDSFFLRQKRFAIIRQARGMVRAARAFAKVNPSQRAAATLRGDLHNIARATRYMLACVLGDSARPFDFRNVFAWSEKNHALYNAAQMRMRRTLERVRAGETALA